MKQIKGWIAFICLLFLTACGGGKKTEGKIVSVTIEPQRYFAEKIAGDKFKINCIVPVGQSPETYDPTPGQMIQIGQSDAYLKIGYIGFEQAWMKNIQENNPELKVFDLSEGVRLLTQEEEEHHRHEEGEHPHHHHHHDGVDPHIWNSINGAETIAKNTLNAFITLDPENRDYYESNYNLLMAEIESTEKTIQALLAPVQNRIFIIYHPALTYFAHEFGFTQLCIEMDGKEPSPALLKELVETAKEQKSKVVFIQQEFDQKNAELIAKETGCLLEPINPLDYHWNTEMIHIAKTLADGQAD